MQAQAVTSKWDIFDQEEEEEQELREVKRVKSVMEPDDDDDVDGVPMGDFDQGGRPLLDTRVSEDRRARLREVELQVMTYQDELEAGRQPVRPGWTISEQVRKDRLCECILKFIVCLVAGGPVPKEAPEGRENGAPVGLLLHPSKRDRPGAALALPPHLLRLFLLPHPPIEGQGRGPRRHGRGGLRGWRQRQQKLLPQEQKLEKEVKEVAAEELQLVEVQIQVS